MGACVISSFLTSFFSLPLDNIKIKLQKQREGEYAGMRDCFVKTVRREGVRGLWSGMRTYFISITPMSFIILLVIEHLR